MHRMRHAQERRRAAHNDTMHIRAMGQSKGNMREQNQKGMDKGTMERIHKDEAQDENTHATRTTIRQPGTETERGDMGRKRQGDQTHATHENSHRMTRLGRTSMTGIALHQRTGQEWITIIANKARELKEQQQDMDREQRQARRSELEEMRKTQRKQQREDDQDDQLLQQIQERQEALSIKRANQRDPFGEATS
jgi:hypothetical protein